MPRVSVIVPFYNRESVLAAAIDSVLNQNYTDWELLLVDDGSVDKSAEIVKKYVGSDPRIKSYKRTVEKKGPCACRNIGAKNAAGEYLVFFDSDDLMAPHCLASRVQAMDQNPSLDFAVFNLGTFIHTPGDKPGIFNLYRKDALGFLELFLSLNTPWGTPCPIWKKHFFLAAGGFNEEFLVKTDPELHTRVLLLHHPAFQYFKDSTPDIFYRINYFDATKKEYISKAAVYYRIKYIREVYKMILEQHVYPKQLLLTALSHGILVLYKTYFVNAVGHLQDEYFDFLKWSFERKLLSKRDFVLLQGIGRIKLSRNPVVKRMRLSGLLYRLI